MAEEAKRMKYLLSDSDINLQPAKNGGIPREFPQCEMFFQPDYLSSRKLFFCANINDKKHAKCIKSNMTRSSFQHDMKLPADHAMFLSFIIL